MNSDAPPRLRVDLHRFPCRADDPFETFLRLRETEGEQEVFLLESLAGPAADRTRAMVGATPVLDLVVRDGVLELDGHRPWREWAEARMRRFPHAHEHLDRRFRLRYRTALWEALRHLEHGFDVEGLTDHRFGFGFLSLLGYETAAYIEPLPRTVGLARPAPDAVFRIYRSVIEIDLVSGEAELTVANCPGQDRAGADPAAIHRRIEAALTGTAALTPAQTPAAPLAHTEPETTIAPASYDERIETALRRIDAGELRQVRLGHEVHMRGKRSDLEVYLRMRANDPSPYMGFVPYEDLTLLSASPQLHVRLEGGRLTMRPVTGTIPRGADAEQDAAHAGRLRGDAKESAEHGTLIDLCREDLGRVAEAGTVKVTELMNVEPYYRVLRLVSTVTAVLAEGRDAYDVVRATFPAGSVTGAPKPHAMALIEAAETNRRGMHAGAFGLIGFGGFTNLALSVRTVIASGDAYTARAAAGVTAGCSPEGEWRKTLVELGSSVHAVAGTTAAAALSRQGDAR